MAIGAFAQEHVVRGVVTSAGDGLPLERASVLIKGTTTGVVTDADGRYTITARGPEDVLMFMYTGYDTQEFRVGELREINVQLQLSTEDIDEVVVTAYGKAKKSSLVGSSQSVSSEQLQMRPVSSATQALGGMISGVQVTAGTGQPGSSPAVRIRGFGSFAASGAPLIVVDGTIFNGSMADIAPSDIASVSVLKDAASTALYGSSAGNGVILVTTRQGQQGADGKAMVTLFTSHGISARAIPEYDLVDVWDYYPAMWQQLYNASLLDPKGKSDEQLRQAASANVFDQLGANPFKGVEGDQIVGLDGKLNPKATELLYGDDLDWLGAVQRLGYRREYGANVSYGNKVVRAYSSFNYMKEDGYSLKTMYERYSARFNASYDATKWFTMGGNVQVFRTTSTGLGSGGNAAYANPFMFARRIAPIYPIHKHAPDGQYTLDPNGEREYDFDSPRGAQGMAGRHIVAETLWNDNKRIRDGLDSRAFAEINILPFLKFTTNFNYRISRYGDKDFTNEKVGDAQGNGRLEYGNGRSSTVTFNQLLDYNQTFAEVHNVSALLGHENYRYNSTSNSSQKTGIVVPGLLEYGNFIKMEDMASGEANYRKEGYFARANYDYANRYYFSASYRYDGTSRFHPKRRWGHFWSVGASWRIEQEAFMREVRWVDFLKLRASYGLTGIDDISGYYPYMSTLGIGWNNYTTPGILFGQNGNPELCWETQISTDVALEFSFLNRIRGTIEFFNKESKDLLFSVPVPLSSGFKEVNKNLGKIRNYGLEAEFDFTLLKMGDLTWTFGLNLTHLRNKIVKLPEGQKEIAAGTKKYMEGRSMYDFWLREFMGIDEETGKALYRYDPTKETANPDDAFVRNGDSLTFEPNYAKYHYCGSSIPKLYGGFNMGLSWKGIDFGVVFSYQLGSKFYDGSYAGLMDLNQFGASLHKDAVKEAWTPDNRQAKSVALNTKYAKNASASSDRWLISGNALALKSVRLGYTFPKKWYSMLDISSVRLSVAAENLWFFTARKGMNPMYNYAGTSSNVYLTARTLTGTLTVNF